MARGTSPGKSLALLAGAALLACIALLVLFGRPPAAAPPEAGTRAEPHAGAAAEAPSRESPAAGAPISTGTKAQAKPGQREPEPPAEPGAEAAVPGEEASDPAPPVASGIGLFPPPGTDPVKVGIVVPEDFELPEGFLRHYQATDDGQELPPILLFHPDYEVLGDDGRPIPLPEDRVVPPDLAPPGLPIELLVLPEPRDEDAPAQ
jgi:hypothetical protein